jgi:hypothetical protein
MNTFKRKALFAAVLAGVGAAGTAEAVYLNPNGTGQVLIYPYYTVQGTSAGNAGFYNTYLSVTNTTSAAKMVKVRFLEGKASAEVLDFNLYLSPNDVWTAAIVPADATSATSPARIITADNSCTAPAIGVGSAGASFVNYQFAADTSTLGNGLDRTREGYVEIIEMATLTGTTAANVTHASSPQGTPEASSKPANCAAVQSTNFVPPNSDILPPSGGLMGSGTLINVANGTDAGYKADALEAFSATAIPSQPSSLLPTLASANPAVSLVVNAGTLIGPAAAPPNGPASMGITAYMADFSAETPATVAGRDAVSSVFMASSVMNEYILDDANAALTDWVITHPTKRFYYGSVLGTSNAVGVSPFSSTLTGNGACETFSFAYFNREEQVALTPSSFSPPVPGNPTNGQLCYEANVVTFKNGSNQTNAIPAGTSGVLFSKNTTSITLASNTQFPHGWALISYTGANATTTGLTAGATSERVAMNQTAPVAAPAPVAGAFVFQGLPTTGFMVRTFANGTLTCGTASCQGNYMALFAHSYRKTITP